MSKFNIWKSWKYDCVCCSFECIMSWIRRHVLQKCTLFLEPTFFCLMAQIYIISWYNHFLLCGIKTYMHILSWYNLFLLNGRNIHCLLVQPFSTPWQKCTLFLGTAFSCSMAETYIVYWCSLFLLPDRNIHYFLLCGRNIHCFLVQTFSAPGQKCTFFLGTIFFCLVAKMSIILGLTFFYLVASVYIISWASLFSLFIGKERVDMAEHWGVWLWF